MSKSMKVSVKLYSLLVQSVGEKNLKLQPGAIRSGIPFEVNIPSGSTLQDLARSLSLPEDLVKIVFVNGVQQKLSYQLQAGDQVGMFPPIAGG
jgi:molybdopterin synthase sulfur carrier subunit